MRNGVLLLLNLLGIACAILTLSFTHTTVGRGKSARTELRIGLVDPWLTRTNNGGRVSTLVQPNVASVLTAVGAVVLLAAPRLVRRKPREPDDPPPPPVADPPENTPIDR